MVFTLCWLLFIIMLRHQLIICVGKSKYLIWQQETLLIIKLTRAHYFSIYLNY